MTRACCSNCRLLQAFGQPCQQCEHPVVPLPSLAQARIESVALVPKKPPSGLRDKLELWGTGVGMSVGGLALGILTMNPVVGILTFVGVGALGMAQQHVRAHLVRRPRLTPRDPPSRPEGTSLLGTAEPLDRTVRTAAGPALAVATTVWLDGGVVVRDVQSVPFWLVQDERRLLVEQPLWLHEAAPEPVVDHDEALLQLGAKHLPLSRRQRRALEIKRVILRPGSTIEAIGTVTTEQRPGLGSYRDASVEVLRAHPGHPLWLEQVPAPDRPPNLTS